MNILSKYKLCIFIVSLSCVWLLVLSMYASFHPERAPGEARWDVYRRNGQYESYPPVVTEEGRLYFSAPQSGKGDIFRAPVDGLERAPLTSHPEFEADVVPSVDEQAIFFSRDQNGYSHIWKRTVTGSEQQFTSGKVCDRPFDISVDSNFVLFERITSGGPLAQGNQTSVWLLDLRSKNAAPTKLGSGAVFSKHDNCILFSPPPRPSEPWETWSLNPTTGEKHRICIGSIVTASHDGEHLIVSEWGKESYDFYLVDQKTWRRRKFRYLDIRGFSDAAFSPCGQYAVLSPFYLGSQRKFELIVYNIKTGSYNKLLTKPLHKSRLRSCPVGIVFYESSHRQVFITILDTKTWKLKRNLWWNAGGFRM